MYESDEYTLSRPRTSAEEKDLLGVQRSKVAAAKARPPKLLPHRDVLEACFEDFKATYDEAMARVKENGVVAVNDRNQVVVHPAFRAAAKALEQMHAVAKTLARFDVEPEEEGMPEWLREELAKEEARTN
jgi:hypothetical protein